LVPLAAFDVLEVLDLDGGGGPLPRLAAQYDAVNDGTAQPCRVFLPRGGGLEGRQFGKTGFEVVLQFQQRGPRRDDRSGQRRLDGGLVGMERPGQQEQEDRQARPSPLPRCTALGGRRLGGSTAAPG